MSQDNKEQIIEIDKIKLEFDELDLLLNTGVSFSLKEAVKIKTKEKREGLLSFVPKYKITTVQEFIIRQPVLSVLDRLSLEFLGLEYNEESMLNDIREETIRIAHSNCIKLARIVAIAVLGIEYEDKHKLEQYTQLFYNNLTPQKMLLIAVIINNMNNYAGFTNSIRLMTVAMRTTKPNRIEENKQA